MGGLSCFGFLELYGLGEGHVAFFVFCFWIAFFILRFELSLAFCYDSDHMFRLKRNAITLRVL